MITKALIYCRVSSQRQVDEGHGLEGQEKRCRDYAKSRGYEIIAVFKDEGVSGGLIEREGMQSLQKELEKYKDGLEKTVVIVDDIKRLARDVEAHFELKRAIYTRNAVLESPSHRFEDTPGGKFVETMLAAHAELERNENRIQVINRMKARLEAGYWPFCNPPGLKYIKDPIHGKLLVSNEPYSSIFKNAIEMFSRDLLITQEDVQNFINQEYLKNGIKKRISLAGTQKILKNILFAGYIEYLPWDIPRMKAQNKGFISYETFISVQNKITKRTKVRIRKDTNKDFPLRRLITCFDCGRPLSGSWNKGRKNYYPNYFCITKGYTGPQI